MDAVYLKHVEMTGLFGYKDLSWDVFEDVNILGGDNGSGKSTVFQVCCLLLGDGFISDVRYEGLVQSVKLLFTNGYTMIWEKQFLHNDKERESGYTYHSLHPGKVEKDGSILVQRVKMIDPAGQSVDPLDIIAIVKTSFLSSFDQSILDSQIINSMKESEDRTYLDFELSSYISFRNARVSQILMDSITESGSGSGDGSSHSVIIKGKDARYLFLFNEALKEYFGERYSIRAGMESRITMTSRQTEELIKYQDLSLGEKEILLLIVLVSNTFDEPVILWLDEPDLGLHVDWQVRLVETLRKLNPNIQLFIATHAPSMVEGNQGKVKEMSEICSVNNGEHAEAKSLR